ncbi:DUF2167 domain-containing protein [Pseudaeromonas paramecii]|uniref:DUF2167 domain-containing protein n=1 Tax=Pseudaeromonas paramecii TaxID=2138166 RepID=A0ABP8QAG7_9GAMM
MFARVIALMLLTVGALSAAEFPSLDNLWQQTQEAALHGPVILKLEDQATLRLPSGYEYIPQPEATRWLQAIGQQGDSRLLGLILSDKQEQDWMIRVRLYRDGYISGDDAKLNADGLLIRLQHNTQQRNAKLGEGDTRLEIAGWLTPPRYNTERHQLIWAADMFQQREEDKVALAAHVSALLLGREGRLHFRLITDHNRLDERLPLLQELLNQLQFNEGKRYEDASPTDPRSNTDLATLVAGPAQPQGDIIKQISQLGVWRLLLLLLLAVIPIALLTHRRSRFRLSGSLSSGNLPPDPL